MGSTLRLVVASTKMFVRSPDVLLAAVLLPVVYVALIELLRKLDFVVHAVMVGAAEFMAVGWRPGLSPWSTSTPRWPPRPLTRRRER